MKSFFAAALSLLLTCVLLQPATGQYQVWQGAHGVPLVRSDAASADEGLVKGPDGSWLTAMSHAQGNRLGLTLQKFSSDNLPQWGDGLLLNHPERSLALPRAAVTVDGNWIIAWVQVADALAGQAAPELFVLAVDPSGQPLWDEPRQAANTLQPADFPEPSYSLLPHPDGGAYLLSDGEVSWIDGAGQTQWHWQEEGFDHHILFHGAELLHDGSIALASYQHDSATGERYTAVEKLAPEGTWPWNGEEMPYGRPVATDYKTVHLASDNEGGVFSLHRAEGYLGLHHLAPDGAYETGEEPLQIGLNEGGMEFFSDTFSILGITGTEFLVVWEVLGGGEPVYFAEIRMERYTTAADDLLTTWGTLENQGVPLYSGDEVSSRVLSLFLKGEEDHPATVWQLYPGPGMEQVLHYTVIDGTVEEQVLRESDGEMGMHADLTDPCEGTFTALYRPRHAAPAQHLLYKWDLQTGEMVFGDTGLVLFTENSYRVAAVEAFAQADVLYSVYSLRDEAGRYHLRGQMQSLDAGHTIWQEQGRPLHAPVTNMNPEGAVIAYPDGGFVTAFVMEIDGDPAIVAQRYDPEGLTTWGEEGVVIDPPPNGSLAGEPLMLKPHPEGGVYLVWTEQNPNGDRRLVMQHITEEGTFGFDAAGVPIVVSNPQGLRVTQPLAFESVENGNLVVLFRTLLGVGGMIVSPDGDPVWPHPLELITNEPFQLDQIALLPEVDAFRVVWTNPHYGLFSGRWLQDGTVTQPPGPIFDHGGNNQLLLAHHMSASSEHVTYFWQLFEEPLQLQRFTFTGDMLWQVGLTLPTPNAAYPNASVPDGEEGLHVLFHAPYGYAGHLHLNGDGIPYLPYEDGPLPVTASGFEGSLQTTVADGEGGFVHLWRNRFWHGSSPADNLYAMRINDGFTNSISGGAQQPTSFALHAPYPNPFNAATRISFTLPRGGRVLLTVHNVLGQRVATLLDGQKTAGTHSLHWQANDHASGLYFLKLEAGGVHRLQKTVLLK